jgi:putative heme-binding domain-containing protein
MFSLPTPALLSAVSRLKPQPFDQELLALSADAKQPISLRLRALATMGSVKLDAATLELLSAAVLESGSAAARIQAAQMLARGSDAGLLHSKMQQLLAKAGPVELRELLPIIKAQKSEAAARPLVEALAKNPAVAAMQESIYRTLLSSFPPALFEQVLLPALTKASAASEAKRRRLPELAQRAARADAAAGKTHFLQGKGSCMACHQIGDKGRAIGPNLSAIGAIRTERDLLESILFPSHTLARDYEAHALETRRVSLVGVIRSHTAEGLILADAAGVEHALAHQDILSDTLLPTSLMPMGLDQTMPEQELLELVAYLRSLR